MLTVFNEINHDYSNFIIIIINGKNNGTQISVNITEFTQILMKNGQNSNLLVFIPNKKTEHTIQYLKVNFAGIFED